MKLCRFELLTHPGQVKSGLVYGGKIYETDGTNPVAIHEAADVRPLPPVGLPPSLRFFRAEIPLDDGGPLYVYGNPSSLIGASQIVPMPEFTSDLDFEAHLAVIVGQSGSDITVEEADSFVLGYSLMTVLVARDAERIERRRGSGPGRSRDFAIALGPVLTTPDELDDALLDAEHGNRYKLSAVARVNGVERRRGDASNMSLTPAEAISAASRSAAIRPGEIIGIGPLTSTEEGFPGLSPGDEIQVAVEKLGTLATKIE